MECFEIIQFAILLLLHKTHVHVILLKLFFFVSHNFSFANLLLPPTVRAPNNPRPFTRES